MHKKLRIEILKQNRNDWEVTCKASPGNLQQVEEFLFSNTQMDSAPVVIAVTYGVSQEQKVRIE